MVEVCEEYLKASGFRTYRVRYHGDTARIELSPGEIGRMLDEELRRQVVAVFRKAGFRFVALDLEGYRTGSMNEASGG